jgi:dTDP-4-dehydrorhamnose 3,5-epimerase
MPETQFTSHPLGNFPESAVGTAQQTPIHGLFALPTTAHHDERGFFVELGKIPVLDAARSDVDKPFIIKQINHAHSKQFVARGYHAEDWNKLITVSQGLCFVSIADIRKDSSTYGTTLNALLGPTADVAEYEVPTKLLQSGFHDFFANQPVFTGSLFLPKGVANSVCVLSDSIDYFYAVDALYEERDPAGDTAFSLFDPTINTTWPFSKELLMLSERDKNAISLA